MITNPPDDFADILDRKNPPKLRLEHYLMLKDIAEVHEPTPDPNAGDHANVAASKDAEQKAWESEFGITRQQYLTYLLNFPGAREDIDYHKRKIPLPVGWDFTREPGRTFAEADFAELEHMPKGVPISKGREPDTCRFCADDTSEQKFNQLTYTNVELLHQYINERGMISSKRMNKNCAKHQRKLAAVIKQARQIGLLSFISNYKPDDPAVRAPLLEVDAMARAQAAEERRQQAALDAEAKDKKDAQDKADKQTARQEKRDKRDLEMTTKQVQELTADVAMTDANIVVAKDEKKGAAGKGKGKGEAKEKQKAELRAKEKEAEREAKAKGEVIKKVRKGRSSKVQDESEETDDDVPDALTKKGGKRE